MSEAEKSVTALVCSELSMEISDLMGELSIASNRVYVSSNEVVEYQSKFRQAKLDLEVLEATQDRRFREEAAELNIRMTEASIAAAVALLPEVQASKAKLNESLFLLDKAKAVHEALSERLRCVHEAIGMLRTEIRNS